MSNKIITMDLTTAEPHYVVSCRISQIDAEALDKLVKTGKYLNRSDVLRTALRTALDNSMEMVQ